MYTKILFKGVQNIAFELWGFLKSTVDTFNKKTQFSLYGWNKKKTY